MDASLQVISHSESIIKCPDTGKDVNCHNVVLSFVPVVNPDDKAKDTKALFVGDPVGHVHISNLSDAGFAGLNLGSTHSLAPAAAPTPAEKPPVLEPQG